MSRQLALLVSLLSGWIATTSGIHAAEIDDYRTLYRRGQYAECLQLVTAAIDRGVYGEAWYQLKADAEFATGDDADALATLQAGIEKYGWSIRLRWQILKVAPYAGQPELVATTSEDIAKLAQASPWRYTDAENLVVLGRWALQQGTDAKEVQAAFLQRARRNNPLHREPRLALGELALQKHDFQLAAEIFREAVQQSPEDPDFLFNLALALHGSDPAEAARLVDAALEWNPQHAAALIWQADRLTDAEQYDSAIAKLDAVLAFHPTHAETLAHLAAINFLQGEIDRFTKRRTAALARYAANPQVDHIIGRELSQKYRFAEGAAHQRAALALDPTYLPARKQLAEDLLRLGQETEGWQVADAAAVADAYDVELYNLLNLRDELERFTTLEADGLRVRMDPHEAKVYGVYVIDLLQQARTELSAKYHVELTEPTLVEIFPHPDDFAVRTFGLPGAGGYLGVCFGNVITANSPASQNAQPVNWESVLWHEYAHVITLNKTHNRMPRWLSEGISVYEERQRNPRWGERMNPAYRDMLLGPDLTPIGELSGAFLRPPSGMHLQFAYFESSLVVEFLIQEYGFESLLEILDDLSVGLAINEAIERRTAPLPQLEAEFKTFVTLLAENYAPGVDWSEPDLAPLLANPTVPAIERWALDNPQNYRGLAMCAEMLMQQEQWSAARPIWRQLYELFPEETGLDAPAWQLAQVERTLGDTAAEQQLLQAIADREDDHAAALIRLLEIETAAAEWPAVAEHAAQLRAIKPLISQPYQALIEASAATAIDAAAIERQITVRSLESLLELAPADPADLHFRLAREFVTLNQRDLAKRQVLMSLEHAPRYRDALQLLRELTAQPSEPAPATEPQPAN